jgi:RND family efflux transporter MFP subunit
MSMVRTWPLLLAAFGVTALGCGRGQPPAAQTKPPEVIVGLPVTKEITDYEEFTGRTDAVDSIDIRARVTGYLDKVNFKEGTEVKQNDVLCEIDPRPYQAEVDRAQANVVQAQAHLTRLDSDYQRAESLLKNQAIGKEDYDRVAGDRAEAAAALGVAKAGLALAQLNLNYTKVISPISGRISRRYVDPGNLVKADDTILTSVVSLDPIYVYYDVDERTLLRIRRLVKEGKIQPAGGGQLPIALGLSDEDDFPHPGVINFVDNRVDPMTGTLRVRGVFPNPPQASLSGSTTRLLSPGMFARVRLPIGGPHKALLIPEKALGTDQGQKYVYVVNGQNVVEYHRVKIGSLKDGLRVIDEGLQPGERVIVDGLQRARPGQKVEPKAAGASKATAKAATAPPRLVTTTAPPPGGAGR